MTFEELKKLIESKYLHRGNYVLSSGISSNLYFDIKNMIGSFDQYVLDDAITDKMHNDIDHKTYSCLGGLELGGALIVASMNVSNLHTKCFIRKRQRIHGLKKMIEGKPVSPILLVDDVLSTGKTVKEAIWQLKDAKLEVAGILCVINRYGKDEFNYEYLGPTREKYPIFSLFNERDFDLC